MTDDRMSPHRVSERMRQVAALADLRTAHRLAARIDMRPDAVTARLRQVAALRHLCLSLGRRPGGEDGARRA